MNLGSLQILAANYFDYDRADDADLGGQGPSAGPFWLMVGIVIVLSIAQWAKNGAKKSEFWMYVVTGFVFGCVLGPIGWFLFD